MNPNMLMSQNKNKDGNHIPEIVILSGKGGTGKTSLTAALTALSSKPAVADCDVDAADLHLLLNPQVKTDHEFVSGKIAAIDHDACLSCGLCYEYCRFGAIGVCRDVSPPRFDLNPLACEGCGVCYRFCPHSAITFTPRHCGQWFESQCEYGPMVHARLGIAAENSGKLVALVRQQTRAQAEQAGCGLILIDGPPGIGCPVIASVTGVDLVLVITEPTRSGLHDLERLLALVKHFGIPAVVTVNKWDLNPDVTREIETVARQNGCQLAGNLSFDDAATAAQLRGCPVLAIESQLTEDIHSLWTNLKTIGEQYGIPIK